MSCQLWLQTWLSQLVEAAEQAPCFNNFVVFLEKTVENRHNRVPLFKFDQHLGAVDPGRVEQRADLDRIK